LINGSGLEIYRLHPPPNIPVKAFWSLIPYDTQTRSVLQTDQRDTPLTSESGTVKSHTDGSVDVYFRTAVPRGQGKQLDTDGATCENADRFFHVGTMGAMRGAMRGRPIADVGWSCTR
jgi:hypothetical protein